MSAPKGVTCYCGDKATTVQNVEVDGKVFGLLYTCDDHTLPAGEEIEITFE